MSGLLYGLPKLAAAGSFARSRRRGTSCEENNDDDDDDNDNNNNNSSSSNSSSSMINISSSSSSIIIIDAINVDKMNQEVSLAPGGAEPHEGVRQGLSPSGTATTTTTPPTTAGTFCALPSVEHVPIWG